MAVTKPTRFDFIHFFPCLFEVAFTCKIPKTQRMCM